MKNGTPEGHAADPFGQQARARLAEAHRLAAARLHLAHEENPDADQQQHGEPGDQDIQQRRRAVVRGRRADHDVVLEDKPRPSISASFTA